MHRNDNGGSLLHDIAHNPISDSSWVELVCSSPRCRNDINYARHSRSTKWKAIGFLARLTYRLGSGFGRLGFSSRSELVIEMAHDNGSTPLSTASQKGNVDLVKWLLQNGAHSSIHLKNELGCLPLDVSREFGPHREVRFILCATC